MSTEASSLDRAVFFRRAVFFVLLIGLTLVHLLVLFRGLDTPQAMDQAQLGRQVARGEGFSTKFIRPLEHQLAEIHVGAPVRLDRVRDTYHSPLNPLILGAVFKLVGADNAKAWEMGPKDLIYPLDRVVALVSTLCFLMSLGVTYLLLSRIFDGKIAGVTALMMVLCDLMWNFSQSGLPQMLLLLLFSCGLYFTYRGIEEQEEGQTSIALPIIAAVFFALMVLAHWLCAWIFFAYVIFAAVYFKPRGVVPLASIIIVGLMVAYPIYRMSQITGQPFGVARFVFYNGLANGSENMVMRTIDLGANPLNVDGLLLKILGTTLVQAVNLIPFLGGILAAPIFFISLLHPFKRSSISRFRWLITLMWLLAAIGMAIFGVNASQELHPNQLHILFAPIMAGYGLAFLSILWTRLEFVATTPFLRNAHYIAIVAFSAAPIVLTLPQDVRVYLQVAGASGWPQWPPYYPPVLNLGVAKWVDNNSEQPEIVVSDQPWAVAWYADTHSLWIPSSVGDFEEIDSKANEMGTRFAGILITPTSRDSGPSRGIVHEFGDFAPLILDGRIAAVTGPNTTRPGFSIYNRAPTIAPIYRRFPYRTPLINQEIIYYSEKEIGSSN